MKDAESFWTKTKMPHNLVVSFNQISWPVISSNTRCITDRLSSIKRDCLAADQAMVVVRQTTPSTLYLVVRGTNVDVERMLQQIHDQTDQANRTFKFTQCTGKISTFHWRHFSSLIHPMVIIISSVEIERWTRIPRDATLVIRGCTWRGSHGSSGSIDSQSKDTRVLWYFDSSEICRFAHSYANGSETKSIHVVRTNQRNVHSRVRVDSGLWRLLVLPIGQKYIG